VCARDTIGGKKNDTVVCFAGYRSSSSSRLSLLVAMVRWVAIIKVRGALPTHSNKEYSNNRARNNLVFVVAV
jgi:hypothetical protein